MSRKRHIFHFFLLYFFYIGAGASFWPFASHYFIDNGITPTELGATMSISTFVAILGFNILGYTSDKIKRLDLMTLILFSAACTLTILMQRTTTLAYVIIIYILYAFISSPTESIIDTWAIESYKDNSMKKYFSIIRAGGSLSYSMIVIGAGLLVSNANNFDRLAPLIYTMAALGIGYIIYLMRNRKINSFYISHVEKEKSSILQDAKKLFGVKSFSMLILKCMLVRIPMSMISVFTPYIFRSVGGGVEEHSLFIGISALLEIPLFVLNTKLLAKFNTNVLIIVPLMSSIIKTTIFVLAPTADVLLLGSVFSTIEFAILYPALRYEASKTAPSELRTTAHSIISIAYFSFPAIVSGFIGGNLVEAVGVNSAFMIALVVLSSVTVVFGVGIFRKYRLGR